MQEQAPVSKWNGRQERERTVTGKGVWVSCFSILSIYLSIVSSSFPNTKYLFSYALLFLPHTASSDLVALEMVGVRVGEDVNIHKF